MLDEAYFEFTDDDMPDGLAALAKTDLSWVVLRTFSKAYGLAGLRVGYAVTSDLRLARAMTAAKTPFNVNAAAQTAALAALEDEAWMRASVAALKHERQRVSESVAALGFRVAGSQTNFLFLDVGWDSRAALDHFLSKGIIIKPWKEAGYETFIRVTIGSRSENDRFIEALTTLAKE